MKTPRVPILSQASVAPRLTPRDPATLEREVEEIQFAIARRAYELFDARGRKHGHDLEDWFQAESELLSPVSFVTTETGGSLNVRANVMGFEQTEITTSIEPRRLVIAGQKSPSAAPTEESKNLPPDWRRNLLLRVIDLPSEIDANLAIVTLKAGVLTFELPKLTKKEISKAAEAA
jgi:HSP20 family protein